MPDFSEGSTLPTLCQRGSLSVMARRACAVTGACLVLLVVGVALGGPTLTSATSVLCFLVGLTGSLVFAIVALVTAIMGRAETRRLRSIAAGSYRWAKRLSDTQADQAREARANDLASKRSSYLRISVYVAGAVLLLVAVPAAFDPELPFLQTMLQTSAGLLILFAALFAGTRLIVWLSNPMSGLSGNARHVAITEDGVLMEPEFWAWQQPGRRLSSAELLETPRPSLQLTFDIALKGQVADQHRLNIPLDAEDVAAVRSALSVVSIQ